jgi:hypothetical protein
MNLEFVDISLYKSIVIIGNHIWFRGNGMNSNALEGNERFSKFKVSFF